MVWELSEYRRYKSGDEFKGFTILNLLGVSDGGHYQAEFQCSCGNPFTRSFSYMDRNYNHGCISCSTESSADAKRKFKIKDRRLYGIWKGMNYRCTKEDYECYEHYGGRGISVCSRWSDDTLEGFDNFFDDMGIPEAHLSIDRIDVNGNYEIGNCRWATTETQANNTRRNHVVSYKGEDYTITLLARKFDIKPNTLEYRILRGWSVEDAVEGKRKLPWVRPYKEKLTDEEFNQLLKDRFESKISLPKLKAKYGVDTGQLSRILRKEKVLAYYNNLEAVE